MLNGNSRKLRLVVGGSSFTINLNGMTNYEKVAIATGGRLRMKKAIMVGILALAAACMAQAQDVTGDWQGSMAIGAGVVRIVLHITKSPEGTLKATMDSPDQGAVDMPVDSISLDGNKLKYTTSAVKGAYEGTVKNNGTING